MKKIFLLFILLNSCVNTGSTLKESPSIKKVKKEKCEIVSFFSSNKNKKIVKCNSGYSFEMPNEEIDNKSCRIKKFKINLGSSYTLKESLQCKDFENEDIITIY